MTKTTETRAEPVSAYDYWVSLGKPHPIHTAFAEAYANYRLQARGASERERAAKIAESREISSFPDFQQTPNFCRTCEIRGDRLFKCAYHEGWDDAACDIKEAIRGGKP